MQLFRVYDRLIPFLELLPVPFHVAPVVQTQFEILCELEARRRASVFAEAAKHASRQIKYVCGQRFLALRVTLPADFNTMLRASQRTEIACNAQSLAVIRIVIEPWSTAETLCNLRPYFGILFGVIQGRALI